MARLAIITWLWGDKYTEKDVVRLQKQVAKWFRIPHSFTVFSDRDLTHLSPNINACLIKDLDLCDRSCFCRLRMFDPEWQKENGFDEYIVSLDLDLVITGSLDGVLHPISDFKILQGVNAINPCPYNGSMIMLKAGCYSFVWENFSLLKAYQINYHEFPDDQGWIWNQVPNADGWKGGQGGVYAFQKPGWPYGSGRLPSDAKIVAFVGKRKPSRYQDLDWVMKHWLLYDRSA